MNFRTKLSAVASTAEFRFRVDGGSRLQNRPSIVRPAQFLVGGRRAKIAAPNREQEDPMTTPIKPRNANREHEAAMLTIAACASRPVRIPRIEPTTHPVLVGNRNYLRTLRAAEMAAWEAGLPAALAESFSEAMARAESE